MHLRLYRLAWMLWSCLLSAGSAVRLAIETIRGCGSLISVGVGLAFCMAFLAVIGL